MRRFELSDEQWLKVENMLPGRKGDPGQTAKDNRLFLDAVLWITRTGAPWRDLPERFGEWNNVFQRFNRWAKKGVWQRVFDRRVQKLGAEIKMDFRQAIFREVYS
jgi:transposase